MGQFEAFVGVNFWTALFVLLNTLTIYFVAKKFLFKPVRNMLDARKAQIDELISVCRPIIEEVVGIKVGTHSGSTDCNIPLSMGIPALCMGVYRGGGSHTREEWVEKNSLAVGLEIAVQVMLKLEECL